jgi:hypothetical protein
VIVRKAFRLALGAEAAARHVEAHQRLVGRRIDLDLGGQDELIGQVRDRQVFGVEHILVGAQRLAVHRHGLQFQPLAVQHQRFVLRTGPAHRELGLHAGLRRMQLEDQSRGFDGEREGTIVRQTDGLGRVGAHSSNLVAWGRLRERALTAAPELLVSARLG